MGLPDKKTATNDRNVRIVTGNGEFNGSINLNLMGETKEVDRVSELLNCPGKKWLTVHEASYEGEAVHTVIINYDFISYVSDSLYEKNNRH